VDLRDEAIERREKNNRIKLKLAKNAIIMAQTHVLIGAGNPLLDISAVTGPDLLDK
jgi:hypothetical protein